MAKVILISQFPLPYSKIGSWTTLYSNYLRRKVHEIDHIICPAPDSLFDGVDYRFANPTLQTKVQSKFGVKSYANYFNPLKKIINRDEKYVIQIVDNQGIVGHLDKFLKKNHNRKNFYLQYFHHGFGPFVNNSKAGPFFKSIDELVLLTYDSYTFYKNYFTVLPVKISVLHNGIDTDKFHKPTANAKLQLKELFDIANKKVFIWCSKDRPKKGLGIVLEAWRKVYRTRQDILLLVIGGSREPIDGVRFVGTVANESLAQYYQAADVYLFSTLCQEGFGMTLIEALHCGNYCIASSLGGVPEVLQYGKLGVLLDNPHFVDAWVKAIEAYLANTATFEIPRELYTTEAWNSGMDVLINNAKFAISS